MKEGSRYLDSWRKERGQYLWKKLCEEVTQVWLFLLVSPFCELILFPPFVLAILDLYCEHFSSHLRRFSFSNFLVGFF